jgi:MoxR-like ATPase
MNTHSIDPAIVARFPALSNVDRVLVKQAILNHPNGKPTLKALGLSLRFAKREELALICATLGIDPVALLAAHKAQTAALMAAAAVAPIAPVAAPVAANAAPQNTQNTQNNDTDEDMQEDDTDMNTQTQTQTIEDTDAQGQPGAAILSPYSDVIHPKVMAKLAAAIDATISNAVQAAQAKAAAIVARPVALAASRNSQATLGKVFDIKGRNPWLNLPVWAWHADASTPGIDPGYIFDAEALGAVMASIERGSSPWLFGPKGSGKTELAEQIAARTGRPFVRIGFADDMDKYALIGQRLPAADGSGAFVWHDGIFTAAIRKPGCVILLDEVSAAKPGLLFMFQTCLDRKALFIEETGEKVAFADGVIVMAADNTDGHGDETNSYAGTGALNHAFLDRFPRKVAMTTPDRATLAKIITSRTGLALAAADMLAGVIKASEAMSNKGELSAHLSLRPVLEFARDVQDRLPIATCVETTLLRNLPAAEAQAVRQHVLAHLDLKALAMAAHPQAMAADVSTPGGPVSPQGQAARSDFGVAA